MPKASPIQPSFSAGVFGPRTRGRVDSERYKQGLEFSLNYIPTTQGPLLRRPGGKYTGANAIDPAKPPAFIPFNFSQTQNYVLEFGEAYIRFYTNGGQVVTSSTTFRTQGYYGHTLPQNSSIYFASRPSLLANFNETTLTNLMVAPGQQLLIQSPYRYPDTHRLKVSQKDDVLYIVCSSYPEYKLTRFSNDHWDLRTVLHKDGPYMPLNSYRVLGDSLTTKFYIDTPSIISPIDGTDVRNVTVGSTLLITAIAAGSSGIRVTTAGGHNFETNQRVFIRGVVGTAEANNNTSSISAMSWAISRVSSTQFDLLGTTFVNAYVGSGTVNPAFLQPLTTTSWADYNRLIAFINPGGGRSWARITGIADAAHFSITREGFAPAIPSFVAENWYMGTYSPYNGYPNAITFHQDRKVLGGVPALPQEIQMSVVGDYENFATSGSSLIVSDSDAVQFTLASKQKNQILWLASDTKGLLAGTAFSEWKVVPSNEAQAITPTNINASQTSFFGSHDADAVQAGNATLYIQNGQRRVREMNYFFQVDNYRSTDLTELSDHLTVNKLQKLTVGKETIPIVWALTESGELLSMSYNRDDTTLKVGWVPHQLGGRSDSAGSPPIVKTIATIPSPDGSYDQLWYAAQRFINGTSVVTIEYLTKPFDDSTKQEDSFHFDCGATYDSPVTITGISSAGSAIVQAASHGFVDGDRVRIDSVIGLNSSVVDVNGIVNSSNLVNGRVFRAASTSVNAFFLTDVNNGSSYIDSRSYSGYFSGGQARKLVTTVSGLTWLKNEEVSILGDGGVQPNVIVNSGGIISLSSPAAKIQIGYDYNSDAKSLRPDAGSATGSAVGKRMRLYQAAFLVHNTGKLLVGPSFDRLTPVPLSDDEIQADAAQPLVSKVVRDSLESEHDFNGQICWRQNAGLPGMIQSLTLMLETNDV